MMGIDLMNDSITEYLETLGFKSDNDNGRKIFKHFTSFTEEVNSLYNGVGLRHGSNIGIIELRGSNVLDFLHRISTNSLTDLPKEGIKGTIFTTEKGRIIDVTTLANFGDYQLLFCSAENKLKIKSWIEKYVITDDVSSTDASEKYRILEIIGPQADSFMTLICGNSVSSISANSFKVFNAEGILFFLLKLIDESGSIKFRILADLNNSLKLIKYMLDNKGPFDFNLIGEEAYNSYRVERGIPVAPNEINDQINPNELRMLRHIDFSKGCYIGQEVIARLETYDKVQKLIGGVRFDGNIDEEGKYELFDENGAEAGFLTSLAYSPKVKTNIGIGFIKKAYCEEGLTLKARTQGGTESVVTVCDLPFKK